MRRACACAWLIAAAALTVGAGTCSARTLALSAATDLSDVGATGTPDTAKAPTLTLRELGHPHPGTRTLTVSAHCAGRCRLTITLRVSHTVEHRSHLHSVTLMTAGFTLTGTRDLRLRLPSAVAAKLAKLRSLTIRITGTATFISRASVHTNVALRHR